MAEVFASRQGEVYSQPGRVGALQGRQGPVQTGAQRTATCGLARRTGPGGMEGQCRTHTARSLWLGVPQGHGNGAEADNHNSKIICCNTVKPMQFIVGFDKDKYCRILHTCIAKVNKYVE